MKVNLPWINSEHTIFNYPEYSNDRQQLEMWTFDYTHILNNLRFHICNKGFDNVSSAAFVDISNCDHDMLPTTIVEDKMDHQNSTISQRFFSKYVEKILLSLHHESEAEFVHFTRNWHRACDERGLDVQIRLFHLHNFYNYLMNKIQLHMYPPAQNYVAGILIKTFEALLHCISTRFSSFNLSSSKSYNSHAISTLAIESFFSTLLQFEFEGLGAPKAVDIPKLISHVVYIDIAKHNQNRGFEFTTSTRDNYPVKLMESEGNVNPSVNIGNHPFDYQKLQKKNKSHKWFKLSKPKQVAKGGHGIHQFFRVDETKLSDEQHYGKKITLQECQT